MMKVYLALLRGINISGKNKLPMPELKQAMTESGYFNVSTYLNSGNVVFSREEAEEEELAAALSNLIAERFALRVPVYVITLTDLAEILTHAPAWWESGNPDLYDNLIFVLPPHTAQSVYGEIGEPSEGLEQVEVYENAIFHSFDRKRYGKANWWKKSAAPGIGEKLTIRTANTLRKILKAQEHR